MHQLGFIKNGEKYQPPVVYALPREMTLAQYLQLSDQEKLGDIVVTDYPVNEDSDYEEVVADGVKTWGALFDELYALIDTSRIGNLSVLMFEGYYIPITTSPGAIYAAGFFQSDTSNSYSCCVKLNTTGSRYVTWTLNSSGTVSVSVETSNVPTNGKILRLYYNDAHTFDFDTKAEHCIYDNTGSGLTATNVQSAIDELCVKKVTETITTNAYRWLEFPQGRTVLNAVISGGYDTILLTRDYQNINRYIARYHVDMNVSPYAPALFDASTAYSVTYEYL